MEFSSFLDYLQLEKKYSQKTIIAYKNDLKSFQNFNYSKFDQKDIKGVNYSQIRSWVVSLVANKISNSSINRKISTLNSYFKFLFGRGRVADLTYKVLFLIFVVIGAAASMNSIWAFSDAMIFAMVFPNMIGLYFLFPIVKEQLKKYLEAIKN